jgi:hypothetical protein
MEKLLVSICLLSLISVAAFRPVSKVDGVFIRSDYKFGEMTDWAKDDSLKVVKVLRDGFWMVAYYDDTRKGHTSFDGLGGGTYKLVNGKYVEHISFYSWDSTAAGQKIEFDYEVNDQKYEQHGMINSDKYRNYPINEKFKRLNADAPLGNSSLEGVWVSKKGNTGDTHIKIYSYPIAVDAVYNEQTKSFRGGSGAMYKFVGNTLTETSEFASSHRDGSGKGSTLSYQIAFEKNKMIQKASAGNVSEEFKKTTIIF